MEQSVNSNFIGSRGKPTGRNENLKLECPWIDESTGGKKPAIFFKAEKSPFGLFYEDKN